MIWHLRTRALSLERPTIMGIVNVTPDSFSDGGRFDDADSAIALGRALLAAGANIIDVGGESTRPGAGEVSIAEELDRVLPVVTALVSEGAVVSIDTSKVEVARQALGAGAEIVNDVTGFRDPAMREMATEIQPGVVVMHMAGTPRTMQDNPTYDDVVAEVATYLVDRSVELERGGLARDRICVDPGIGFGKTTAHNLALLAHIPRLAGLGYPLMIGASRKGFIGSLLDLDVASERDLATAVLSGLVTYLGANAVRVHDVAASRQAVLLSSAIVAGT